VGRIKPVLRRIKYRNIKSVGETVFADLLRSKPVYSDPADDVDEFADQLEQSVVAVLDERAPLKTSSKRCGRKSNRWLSVTAVAAKCKRRQLERRWKRTRRDADRIAYRAACREANANIIESRGSFYITNDSQRVLVTREHNGRLCASCSTRTRMRQR